MPSLNTSFAIIGNVASLGYLLGKELRNRGYQVDHYCTYNKFTTMPEKQFVRQLDKSYSLPFERTARKFLLKRSRRVYNVELRLSARKFVNAHHSVMIFNGSELRDGTMTVENKSFVTTKDLLQYADSNLEVKLLPRCFDTSLFKRREKRKWDQNRPLRIGHFPTDRDLKGTSLMLEGLEILRSSGYDCELVSSVGSHEEMPKYLAGIDVLCDQFRVGAHGIISLESLAVGTPVVCYVKEEYFEYPELKDLIVSCHPSPESIGIAITTAINKDVNSDRISQLFSPTRTADTLLSELKGWNMI